MLIGSTQDYAPYVLQYRLINKIYAHFLEFYWENNAENWEIIACYDADIWRKNLCAYNKTRFSFYEVHIYPTKKETHHYDFPIKISF